MTLTKNDALFIPFIIPRNFEANILSRKHDMFNRYHIMVYVTIFNIFNYTILCYPFGNG